MDFSNFKLVEEKVISKDKYDFPYVEVVKRERASGFNICPKELPFEKGDKYFLASFTLEEGGKKYLMLNTVGGIKKSSKSFLFNSTSSTINGTPLIKDLMGVENVTEENFPIEYKLIDISEQVSKTIGEEGKFFMLAPIDFNEEIEVEEEELPESTGEIVEDPLLQIDEEATEEDLEEVEEIPMSI